jgi:hypothetical protein
MVEYDLTTKAGMHAYLMSLNDVIPRSTNEYDTLHPNLRLSVDGLDKLLGGTLTTDIARWRVDWEDGSYLEMHRDGDLNYLHLDYFYSATDGLLTLLTEVLPSFFRKQGIKEFQTTSTGSDVPLRIGFQHDRLRGLICDIREGGRFDQYSAWKRGEAPEPDWRQNY